MRYKRTLGVIALALTLLMPTPGLAAMSHDDKNLYIETATNLDIDLGLASASDLGASYGNTMLTATDSVATTAPCGANIYESDKMLRMLTSERSLNLVDPYALGELNLRNDATSPAGGTAPPGSESSLQRWLLSMGAAAATAWAWNHFDGETEVGGDSLPAGVSTGLASGAAALLVWSFDF